jgi:hypothetical protein
MVFELSKAANEWCAEAICGAPIKASAATAAIPNFIV